MYNGDVAYVKWQVWAVFVPGPEGKPILLDNGFRHALRQARPGLDQLARRPRPSAMSETTSVFKLTPSFPALAASLA